jgi:DeoR/GlpR family transcriptional regulator of sugar metabolism
MILTGPFLEIAQTKRAMIKTASEVILLADSAKWNHIGFIKVAPLAEVDVLISDEKFPAKARAAIKQLGVPLVLV